MTMPHTQLMSFASLGGGGGAGRIFGTGFSPDARCAVPVVASTAWLPPLVRRTVAGERYVFRVEPEFLRPDLDHVAARQHVRRADLQAVHFQAVGAVVLDLVTLR